MTKWLWPWPAFWVTRWCAARGISANMVTAASLVLAILAMGLFARGYFGAGLVAAWLMTFLDTVDGKLARVTLTSSRIGNVFDHGIDLLHPPFWYVAWDMGLALDIALDSRWIPRGSSPGDWVSRWIPWRSRVPRCRCSTSSFSRVTWVGASARARSSAGSRRSRSSPGALSTPGSG